MSAGNAPRDRLDLRAILVMVVLCACWGLQQVTVKVALQQGLAPSAQATLRSAGAALLVLLWVAARGGRPGLRRLFRADASLLPGAILGLVFAGEFLLIYFGLRFTSAARGILFLYTAPFFVALGVHFFVPAERLGGRQALGLLCAFLGVAVASGDGMHGGTMLGDAMETGGAALWAVLTLMAKAVPALRRISPARVLFYQLAGSVPVLLAVALARGELGSLGQGGALAWLSMAYQTCLVAFATYLAWYWLISRYPAGRLAAFSFLTPIFGLLAAAVLLGDRISPALALALAGVVLGLRLVNGGARRLPAPRAVALPSEAD